MTPTAPAEAAVPGGEPAPVEAYRESFLRLLPRLSERSLYFDRCRAAAGGDFRALLGLLDREGPGSPACWEARFRNPCLIPRLIEKSAAEVTVSPERARDLAAIAFRLAGELDLSLVGEDVIRDLALRSRAYEANAERALGHLTAAEELFRTVLAALPRSADPMLRAEVLSLASSLEKDRRRLPEARQHLAAARALYESIGDRPLLGRTLLKEASLHFYQGEPELAILALEQSLPLLGEGDDPRLLLCGRHNLADYLCAAGRYERARQVLADSLPLYRRFASPGTRLRRRWVEGKIACGRGEPEEAEAAFREVRAGFTALGILYDAAMVSLDLMGLYLDLGRQRELRQLATEAVAAFRALDVPREALTALLALEQAARREAVSRQLMGGVLTLLRGTWSPDLERGGLMACA